MTPAQEAELRNLIRAHRMAQHHHKRSPVQTSRLCACGCGQRIDTTSYRKRRRYASYRHWYDHRSRERSAS